MKVLDLNNYYYYYSITKRVKLKGEKNYCDLHCKN